MNKIIATQETVSSEIATKQEVVKWDQDAVLSLQSLERYTILKALEEGKTLVKRVIEVASADTTVVSKFKLQSAIAVVLEEMDKKKVNKPA